MKFKENFFENYLSEAPLALALERIFECYILSGKEFTRPILDIGSGDGIFSFVLFDEKIDVGIEPDAKELERSKKYGMYKELLSCSGDNIPKETGSFKTIFANSVLEHIPDMERVLRGANRVLTDDGKMYVTLPTKLFDKYGVIYQFLFSIRLTGLAERYRRFFNKFWKHYHSYDEEGWKAVFQKCGFSVADCREYNPKTTCILNDFLVPFSSIAFLNRKFLKRWFLIPAFRKFIAKILVRLFKPVVLRNLDKREVCGLIFFEIRKART